MNRLFTALALLVLVSSATAAHAVGISVGGFGGISIPIVQDDTDRGTMFGARVPVSLAPLLTVEPFFSTSSGGDKDQDLGGTTYTRSGIDVKSFGANVLFPFGSMVRFYPFAGIGSHKLERQGSEAITKTGYNFGLGFGFSPPVANLSIDVRGEMNAVVDGDVSRKWANATVGLSYNLIRVAAK